MVLLSREPLSSKAQLCHASLRLSSRHFTRPKSIHYLLTRHHPKAMQPQRRMTSELTWQPNDGRVHIYRLPQRLFRDRKGCGKGKRYGLGWSTISPISFNGPHPIKRHINHPRLNVGSRYINQLQFQRVPFMAVLLQAFQLAIKHDGRRR